MPSYRVLTGPTAAGKTDWLLARARRVPCIAVVADSRQVYRHMDIGTGKPDAETLAVLPHLGLDVAEPNETFSAYRFILTVAGALKQAEPSGAEVWVIGGTGLYIRALVEGLPLGSVPNPTLREALRSRIEQHGASEVARQLALRLRDPANPVRVLRAAENLAASGEPGWGVFFYCGLAAPRDEAPAQADARLALAHAALSRWRCGGIHVLDPGTAELQARIEQRVTGMFASGGRRVGLTAEVRYLRELGYGAAPVVAGGIGYREAGELLDGKLDRAAAIERAIIRTRQYAKRQRTYFKGQRWRTYTTLAEVELVSTPDGTA